MDVHIARSMLSGRQAARRVVAEPWGLPLGEGLSRPLTGLSVVWERLRRMWR